jgi:HlyD family secretion protein
MRHARSLLLIAVPLLILAGCGQRAGAAQGTGGAATPTQAPAGGGTKPGTKPGAQTGGQAGAQAGGRRTAVIAVQAVTVASGPLVTDNDTAGTVVPVMQSQVAAQVSGVVAKVLRKPGDSVKEGAIVVQLDDAALRLAVRNAHAGLENARINLATGQQTASGSNPKLADQLRSAQESLSAAQKSYDSQKAQYDLGGISSSALDTARSQLDQAEANVEGAKLALDQNQQAGTQNLAQLSLAVDQASNQLSLAQLSLQNAAVRAPFAGQIAAVNVTPGMYVSLTTPTFLLVSADKQINFTEPPTDAPNFKVGDVVQFTYGGKSHPVKVIQTPSAPINGVVPMVASAPANLPVSYGTVGTITYRLTIGSGPQIPLAALQSRANLNFVFTIADGKAAETPATIIAEAGATAVVSGVQPGVQVIISPPPGLLPGSAVQVVGGGK